jgi:hypothetical protein
LWIDICLIWKEEPKLKPKFSNYKIIQLVVSRMISRSGVCGLNFTKRSSFSTSGSRFPAAVNTRVGHEPNRILQFSFAKRGQRIRQTAQQFIAVRSAKCNDNCAVMFGKGQRNGVEKILVRADENGALLLGVGKQLFVGRAGRKDFQSVNSGVSG